MSETGKSDRWNSLLETLGVPASESKPALPAAEAPSAEAPPAPAKPQSISMLRPEKAKPAPKPKAASQPAKSPSYWSRIAGALGLESAAPPEPPAVEETKTEEPRIEEPRAEEPPRAFERPRREQRPREDRPRHEDRPRREERQRRDEPPRESELPPRSSLDEMFGPKPADVDVFGLRVESDSPRVREPSTPRDREDEDRGSVLEYDRPEGSGSDLPLGATPPREDRDQGDEGAGREGRGRRRRRGRGRGRRGDVEGREGAPRAHEADIEPAGEEADFDIDRDAEFDLDAELRTDPGMESEQSDRGQRRDREAEPGRYPAAGEREGRDEGDQRGGRTRRRRGRRGRRDRDETSAPGPSPYSDTLDKPERFGPPRDQRGPASRAARPDDDEIDDDLSLETDDADEGDEGRGGDVPTHKKIPTWNEAVGILIDANMASRANSPDRDHGRGRGRGRR